MARISVGSIGCTGVRHASSNSRMVCLSTAPTSCSASIVSWIAANASLFYFFVIAFYLHELSCLDQRRQMCVRQAENVPGHAPELLLFIFLDIVAAALGEAEDEEGTLPVPVEDDRSKAARPTLARPRDTLLDDAAAKVGVDLPTLGPTHRVEQHRVGNSFLARETPEPGIPEYPHRPAPLRFTICHL